jgi:hypothetical protein
LVEGGERVITPVVQRWRARRGSYRPAGETINVHDYDVAAIADDTTAKRFVLDHHYSGTYPAARRRFGFYHRERGLVGVAVFSVPQNPATLAPFPGDKSRETLHAAKRAEHAVDQLLEELKAPAGQQGRLF